MLSTLLIGLGKVWVWAEDLGKVSADCLGRVWDSIWWARGLGKVWWCGAGRWIDAVLTLLQTKTLHKWDNKSNHIYVIAFIIAVNLRNAYPKIAYW